MRRKVMLGIILGVIVVGIFIFFITMRNTSPQIKVLTPSFEGAIADDTYTIAWKDEDPDDAAEVSLYYDTDSEGRDGELIVSGLSEDDETDFFVWDTSVVEEGTYFVYAKIDDGKNPPVYSYSEGQIEIIHNVSPTISLLTPPYEGDKATKVYKIKWSASDPDSDAMISLYYDRDNIGEDGELIVDGLIERDKEDSFTWDVAGVKEGSYYVYAKVDDGVNPPVYSYSQGRVTIGKRIGRITKRARPLRAPRINSITYRKFGTSYVIEWDAYNPLDRGVITLYYDTDRKGFDGVEIVSGLPQGLSNSYYWDVSDIPAGTYYIYAKIDDGAHRPRYKYCEEKLTIEH